LDVTEALAIAGASADQTGVVAAGLRDQTLHALHGSVMVSGVTI
jgi:hypothetical protein